MNTTYGIPIVFARCTFCREVVPCASIPSKTVPKSSPKRCPNGHKMCSNGGLKNCPENVSQKCPQMGAHLGTGDVPRAPRRPRRTDQDAPIADQTIARAPRCFQEASKSCPERPRGGSPPPPPPPELPSIQGPRPRLPTFLARVPWLLHPRPGGMRVSD